jgi:FkbM family methyltransferase
MLSTQQQQQQQRRRHARVTLLKVDIEGHEPEALAGAAQLLGGNLVDNVLLEYAPHFAEMQK